jgi:DNA-binding cell septation regulator SpoVG
VEFAPASASQRARGVLGFVKVSMNGGVRVPGFTVVSLPQGKFDVRLPTKRDEHGQHHDVMQPLRPTARRSIVRQVLDALREQGVIP